MIVAIVAALAFWVYVDVDEPSNQFVYIFPYLVTLIVVSVRSQSCDRRRPTGIP